MPKVSVIVPVYKVEKYVSRCIESILNQTYTDWELILVDDGSPDSSGVICDKYACKDSRIKVIHKENGGVSSARNVGLDNATGEWVTFVDADDWIARETIHSCSLLFEKSEIIRFSMNHYVGSSQLKASPFSMNYVSKQDYLSQIVARKTILGVCGGIYRLSLFDKQVNYFDGKLVNGEDWVVLTSLVEKANYISFIERPLYVYNKSNDNSCTNRNSIVNYYSAVTALNCINTLVSSSYSWKAKSIAMAKCDICYSFITAVLSSQLTATADQIKAFYRIISLRQRDIILSKVNFKHRIILSFFTTRTGLFIVKLLSIHGTTTEQ